MISRYYRQSKILKKAQHLTRKITFLRTTTIALTCLISSSLCWTSSNVYAQDRATRVTVDVVATAPLVQTVDVLGRLVSRQGGVVAAQVAGPVVALPVQVGDAVEKGDLIAEININELLARQALWQSEVQRAEALVTTRKAESKLARQTLKRLEKLNSTRAVDRASYDDARQQQVIASARLGEAQSATESAQANLRLAEVFLENRRVLAPYTGIISNRITEVGSYVSIGDGVVEMLGNGSLEIEADVPVDRLAGLAPAAEVEVLINDKPVVAHVRAIIPVENPRTRARAVRFTAPLDATGYAVGQTVVVRVPLGAPRNIMAVHKDAIIRRGSNAIVYVVVDNVANPKTVELGDAVGAKFEVLSGLTDGDSVVIRGNERLRPGTSVNTGGTNNGDSKTGGQGKDNPEKQSGQKETGDKQTDASSEAKLDSSPQTAARPSNNSATAKN